MDLMAMVAAFVFGSAGAAAGSLARLLVGRLRRGARVRAPLCEVGVGLSWAAVGGLWGAGGLPAAWLPALLGLGWLGVAAGVVDLRHHRLPDALTLPAAGVAPVALVPLGAAAVGRGLLGSVVAVVGYGAVHALRPAALGAGDVKLAACLGAVLAAASWDALPAAAVLAALLTGAAGLTAACAPLAKHRVWARHTTSAERAGSGQRGGSGQRAGPRRDGWRGREAQPDRPTVPHGPSMLVAAWLVTVAAAVSSS